MRNGMDWTSWIMSSLKAGYNILPAFSKLILLAAALLIFATVALAADPGHPASSVAAGTFESGNYTFPDSAFVTNNLGVGITTPGNRLEVKSSGTTTYPFRVSRNSGTALLTLMEDGTNNAILTLYDSAEATKVLLRTDGGANYLITGNFGIATSSPTQKLDVNGSVNVSGSSGVLYTPQVCLAGDCKTAWPTAGGGSTGSGWTNTSQQVSLSNTANNVSANTLYVDNTNGRVGIGTTGPITPLQVVGTSYLGNIRIDSANGPTAIYYTSAYGMATTDNNSLTLGSYPDNLYGVKIYNSRVGINLSGAIPSNALEVIGNINATQLCIGTDCRSSWPAGGGSSGSGWTNTSQQVSLTTSTNNVSANTLYVDNTNGRVGIGTTAPNSKLEIGHPNATNDYDVNFYGGHNISGWGDEDARFWWDASKGALRAGTTVNTDAWDDTKVGEYSVALGFGNTASNGFSTAMGSGTIASGSSSTAMGTASTASGVTSIALGAFATASGDNSIAMGVRTTAQAYASVVLGRNNVISGTNDSWVATDPLFIIGNGVNTSNPANALTVLKNGNVGIGETAPAAKLVVAGNVNITGDVTVGGNNVKDSTNTTRIQFSSGSVIILLG